MHVLIFRFSAMGDVALTLPVIRGALNDNPDLQITIVTKKFYASFFEGIENLHVFSGDFKKRHKGLPGIIRLFKDLNKQSDFDLVIDLHSVLRTRILRLLFWLKGIRVLQLDKERNLKKQYTKSSIEPNLPHTIDRYSQVFRKANITLEPQLPSVFQVSSKSEEEVNVLLHKLDITNKKLVGIAPFAKHELKIWPTDYVKRLIKQLLEDESIYIFLFGGGKEELNKLNEIKKLFTRCWIVDLSISGELALMRKLCVMITMDSGNMHLASLSGIPVISIWGATHVGIGFGPWKQPTINTVQIPKQELTCRPCTVYGKGSCYRGDFACMNWIEPEMVYQKLIPYL
jgi:ADP-heptose:LPS heptosyltransferase